MSTNRLVLYVDDDRTNRIVFEHTFNKRFAVKVAESGLQALDILEHEPVAVLVSDQRMPGMSGNELLVRAMQNYPDVVRIVITAYSDFEPILRAVNDGIVARYIIKPWDRAELEGILDWAVEAHAVGKQNSALQLRLMQTERLVTIGSIAGAIIHDINGPLAYLDANTSRLSDFAVAVPALAGLLARHGDELAARDRNILNELVAELPEILSDMGHGFELLRDLTTSMRRLLRAPSNEEIANEPVAVIRSAVSLVRRAAAEAGAELIYDGAHEMPPVKITLTELSQVLINLMTNAIQSLAPRKTVGARVTVYAVEESDRVRFAVADNGPGIPADAIEKVGTLFFTTRKEGTGLGLAQCRRLVEKYGGHLKIDSPPGQGVTVSFTIPKA